MTPKARTSFPPLSSLELAVESGLFIPIHSFKLCDVRNSQSGYPHLAQTAFISTASPRAWKVSRAH